MSTFLTRRLLLLMLLFAGIATIVCLADRAPLRLQARYPEFDINADYQDYLDGVVSRTFPGPLAYRVLSPYLVFWLHQSMPSVPPLAFDFVIKVLLLTASQICFFQYLRHFFACFPALAGVLWFDALMGFALSFHQGPSLLETGDLVNVFIFILALLMIHRDRLLCFCLTLFWGTLNRETTWFLLPVLFLNDWHAGRPKYRAILAFMAIAVPYFGLRWLIEAPAPHWVLAWRIEENIPFISSQYTHYALIANLHVAALIGPLVVMGLYRFHEHPPFLRTVASIAPLFIAIHYIIGRIIEVRLWMPLFLILIPLALNNFVKEFQDEATLDK